MIQLRIIVERVQRPEPGAGRPDEMVTVTAHGGGLVQRRFPLAGPIPPLAYAGRWMTTVALPASLPVVKTTNTFSATRAPGIPSPNVVTNSCASAGG